MATDNEVWRPVVGYEGMYEVSNLGRVRSVPRYVVVRGRRGAETRLYEGRVLSLSTARNGYRQVVLSRHGVRSTRTVHSLVATAFLGPVPRGQEIRHRDGLAAGDGIDNILYGTRQQNREDSRRLGTLAVGERIAQSKLRAPDVEAIRNDDRRHADIADTFGVSRGQISRIKRGEAWRHV